MSITVTNSGAGWVGSGVNFNLPFTAVTARSLVVIANNESAVNDITGLTDSGGNTWVDEYTSVSSFGNGRRVFRCKTVGTVPTWVKASGSSGTIHYVIIEATGMDSGAIESCADYGDTPGGTSHSATFNSVANNAMAIVHVIGNTDLGTITPTSGFTEIPTSRNARAAFYKEDLGAAGSQSLTYTSSSTSISQHVIAVYKSAVSDPTVTSVTSSGVTEGGNMVFTVSLSGATSGSTNYAFSLGGTATAGTDYTSPLTSGMCNNSVTVSGGNFVAPAAVSSWTVTIPITSDTTDEVDETCTLTVGGVSGTGTITDDDAPPTVSISDATESFGTVTHTLTLSQASGKTITVQVDSANGSKTAGTHYTAIVAQTVTFNPGETEQTVTVTVL